MSFRDHLRERAVGRSHPFDLPRHIEEPQSPPRRNEGVKAVMVITGAALGAWVLIGGGIWLIIKLV